MQEISILARKTVTITVSGSIYSGSNIDLGIKPTDPTTFNINNLLPDDFTFHDNDVSPILSVAPIPPKLQEYLEQFINKEKTGNDDFVSLLSQDHLQFLHSRFLGIFQNSDKTKENEKHPIWSIITQKIKDTSDVNNLFKSPAGLSSIINEYLRQYATSVKNMWNGSIYKKSLNNLLRILLRLHLAPRREAKFKERIKKAI